MPPAPANQEEDGESQVVRVRRVVDGDTLLLKDGTRVRMIGIDTPETKKEGTPVQPFGPEASEYTKKFCEGGTVRLVFDGERHDDYGRLLAHVYVGDRFLSEELIRSGLARVLYRHPYSDAMKDRFRAAENAAKREKKGIWSLPPDKRRGGESPPTPSVDF
ncbi:MAG: thermonuclease family protein [Planctomycetaceae bacterium]